MRKMSFYHIRQTEILTDLTLTKNTVLYSKIFQFSTIIYFPVVPIVGQYLDQYPYLASDRKCLDFMVQWIIQINCPRDM